MNGLPQPINASDRGTLPVIVSPVVGGKTRELDRVINLLHNGNILGQRPGIRQYASRFTSRSEAKLISASRHSSSTLTGNLPFMERGEGCVVVTVNASN